MSQSTSSHHHHSNQELRILFEAVTGMATGQTRTRYEQELMDEAVHDLLFLIRDCDYPELRDEAARIYNGHAPLRKEYEKKPVAVTEIKEILAAARLVHLADQGPIAYDREQVARTELCARILCEFRGMDYDQLASYVSDVPDHDGAGDLHGYRKELAKTRHPKPGPA